MKPKTLIALAVVALIVLPLAWYLVAGARDSANAALPAQPAVVPTPRALGGDTIAFAPPPPGAAAEPSLQTPLPADRLVDEIGINVHFSSTEMGYRYLTSDHPAPNGSSVIRALHTLGVRHVRSSVRDTESGGLGSATESAGRCAAFRAAARNGADFDLVTEIDDTKPPLVNTSEADLRIAVRCLGRFASHLLAVEGPNERGSGDRCNGTEPPPAPSMAPYVGSFGKTPTSECIPEILSEQRVLWLARRDRVLPATTQLWSSAFADTNCEEEYDIAHYSDGYGRYLGGYVDAVSSHAYLAFNQPEFTGGSVPLGGGRCSSTAHLNGGTSATTYDYVNDVPYGTLAYYYEVARYSGALASGLASPKPVVMTATGYRASCCGNSDIDVDVPNVTKYTLRELLATQSAGFGKEFISELVSDSEGRGLTDQYLNPEPVYYALENFIALLGDPGHAELATRPIGLGVRAPGDVTHLVVQKHDGSNWLILWQNDRGYDHATMTPIRVAPTSATVSLARQPSALTSYAFDPATGLVTRRTVVPATAFVVPVSDMPFVLQIGGTAVTRSARPIRPVVPTAVRRR